MKLAHTMGFGFVLATICTTVLFAAPTTLRADRVGDLTFEDRVRAQGAIERVYQRHRSGSSTELVTEFPVEILQAKVTRFLQQSLALAQHWNTRVTAYMLDREMQRMLRDTRNPERLDELFAALGNDPILIRECLARPILVDRLLRNFFSSDEAVHSEARAEANRLREGLTVGEIDPGNDHPRRQIQERSRMAPLDADFFASWRALAPGEVGEIGVVSEDPHGLEIRVVLEERVDWARVAVYRVPKELLERWQRGFEARLVSTVAGDGALWTSRSVTEDCTGGAWIPRGSQPLPRYSHQSVWTGSEMIVWGGANGVVEGGRYDPATDSWTAMSILNAPESRFNATSVWTGTEMIVWGGTAGFVEFDNGGRYDPLTDSWTLVSTDGAPTQRTAHTAVWTGSQMIVWGGIFNDVLDDGARYDPVSDTWSPISQVGAPDGRKSHSAVWIGSEMIVWGGFDSRFSSGNYRSDGARYDPATDSWTTLSEVGVPQARSNASAIWTGTEMIVWGGVVDSDNTTTATGGRYDPLLDRWDVTPDLGAPTDRVDHTAVWTGNEMIVWGGAHNYVSGGYYRVELLGDGGSYEPATDSWSPIQQMNAPSIRRQHTAVWTGDLMIIWGGSHEGLTDTGARYSPATDSWTPTAWVKTWVAEVTHASVVWTGNEMILWGGTTESGSRLGSGTVYNPATGVQRPTSYEDSPSRRRSHIAIWTGTEMIVWGGYGFTTPGGTRLLNDGSRYDPGTDTWSATSIEPTTPSGRSSHSAIWTGSEMIVWGGEAIGSGTTDTGSRYDPQTNSWAAVSTASAPQGRTRHLAFWTGTEMIVWGGENDDDGLIASGGLYDPAGDSWRPISQVGQPTARDGAAGVWTAEDMIIWGGVLTATGVTNTGGRYNPETDTWSATSIFGAPSGRWEHTGVWAETEMIVWGGKQEQFGNFLSDGGRYDAERDSWQPVESLNAPSPRSGHVAVWTGQEMIIWGGVDQHNSTDDPHPDYTELGIYIFTDRDHDGFCGDDDCDDTNPNCNTDCTDVDGDGYCITTDCDETNPNCGLDCTDADGDGFCVNEDCDDNAGSCSTECIDADHDGVPACAGDCDETNPNCTTDCTDADGDGLCVTTDCDDGMPHCDTDCTDVDSDGFCHPADCDDEISTCTTDCTDSDGDGMFACAGDCSDHNANCTTDCTDADSDGFCVTTDCDDGNPFCNSDCTDEDGDGYCVTSDCDDNDGGCAGLDCNDFDEDGVTVCQGDCNDFNPNCVLNCTDDDDDGFCTDFDCDDSKPFCTSLCTDTDGDGYCILDDCDESNPYCNSDCTDDDGDGFCATMDCDENNPRCTSDCTDADGDGFCVTADCDETNAYCDSDCTDADGDDFCVTHDCDETDPGCTGSNCNDQDGDGLRVCEDDCDDWNPNCTTDCTDVDEDGYCVTTDCDDSRSNCTIDCSDADGDDFCVTADCDDSAASCNAACEDLDTDGIRVCDGDCDDSNPNCAWDCTDGDTDGSCVDQDCDDADANCAVDCSDSDTDGLCVDLDCDDLVAACTTDCTNADGDDLAACAGDCDDLNPQCTSDCTDDDDDGYCVTTDCDDVRPNCTTDCTDVDGDDYCVPADCDDTIAECSDSCEDDDLDGLAACAGDCDDSDPTVRPGLDEICTDGADNDCDGLTDAFDAVCSGLVAEDLGFSGKQTLVWTGAVAADSYGLYRGTISATGMTVYNHLCEATELTDRSADDPDVPLLGTGFYYLATGQDSDIPANRFRGGPLGFASNGASRPTSETITCGPLLHVDPDVVAETRDGLSWATAYSSVALALDHGSFRDRGAEVWLRGTTVEAGVELPEISRPGVRLLGGFDGTETASWERSADPSVTGLSGGGSLRLFRAIGTSVVLDGLTMRDATSVFVGLPAGRLTEFTNVRMEQISGYGVDLTLQDSLTGELNVRDSTFESTGVGAIRVKAESGLLTGEIRDNVFSAWSDAALRLEARARSDAEIGLDIVSNVISGGGQGIVLGAHIDDAAATARQSSFIGSNLIHGTSGIPLTVEATGYFNFVGMPALVDASPVVVGNTFVDSGGDGVACVASRNDYTVDPHLHTVRATPQLWDNLITHHAGAGISETADDPGSNLSADPLVVGNCLHGTTPLYRDEGAVDLTSRAEVNALAEARHNFEIDPGYVNRVAQDYHLAFGTVLGFGSEMRYLANETDPGLGLLWTMPGFDSSNWRKGAYGVGFDTGESYSALSLLHSIVSPNAVSVYTRVPFTVDDLGRVSHLILGADFDDGFVVWLNGVEVFRSATVPEGPLDWNTAVEEHESSNGPAPDYEEFDISTTGVPVLVQGENTFAVAVWNAVPSDDLVLVPRLILEQESAAVDTGHPDAPRIPLVDIDGERRESDGDRDGVSRPDVGADERW